MILFDCPGTVTRFTATSLLLHFLPVVTFEALTVVSNGDVSSSAITSNKNSTTTNQCQLVDKYVACTLGGSNSTNSTELINGTLLHFSGKSYGCRERCIIGNLDKYVPSFWKCGKCPERQCFRTKLELQNAIATYELEKSNGKDNIPPIIRSNVRIKYGKDIKDWCVSRLTDLSYLLEKLPKSSPFFNEDLSNWDVSKVTNMAFAFKSAYDFNGNVSEWDVSKVTDMTGMFYDNSFNFSISKWNVSKVTKMSGMFSSNADFNIDLSNWDVSKVTSMENMFESTAFRQDISNWNVGNVQNMAGMFGDSSFNGDLSKWNVSKVTTMSYMFDYALYFNGNISTWDVSAVQQMDFMFRTAVAFDGEIGKWNVSRVTTTEGMFYQADLFNQTISDWNVTSVKTMQYMFSSTKSFNQDISQWDVSRVTSMQSMFGKFLAGQSQNGAQAFNRDISKWNISSVRSLKYMFYGAKQYNQSLCAWGQQLGNKTKVVTKNIFLETDCPTEQAPNLTVTPPGPFCYPCL